MERELQDDDLASHAMSEPQRAQILEALRGASEGLGVADLARRAELHPNTVRWHLGHLADAGLVRARRLHTGRRGRPRLAYEATAGPVEPTSGHRFLSAMLATALEASPNGVALADEAGAVWGRHLVAGGEDTSGSGPSSALDHVVGLLDEHGFEPKVVARTIEMHRCPFVELVEAHGEVVCTLHRGLIAGALEALGAELSIAALEPWARPGVCRARLVAA